MARKKRLAARGSRLGLAGSQNSLPHRRPRRKKETFLFNVQQTGKSLNRQNGFITTLERLSCHRHFKITQAQTKVSFFYLNLYYKVEFRAIFEPFLYILLKIAENVTQYCHVCKSQTTSGPPVLTSAVGDI